MDAAERAELLKRLLAERFGPDAQLKPRGEVLMSDLQSETSVDLHAWCRRYTQAFLTFENREMAMWPSDAARDLGIVEWTIRCLGNPDNADAANVLVMLAQRHGMRVTR